MTLTRRHLLLASASAGLASLPRVARADTTAEKPAIVLIYLVGGYNAFFTAADGYVSKGLYQCSESAVRDVGNGVVVDRRTMGTLPDELLQKMATVGVLHRSSGHDFAQRAAWFEGNHSIPLKLADALQGSAAYRCAHFGAIPGQGAHAAFNGVPMTSVPDLTAALTLFSTQQQPGRPRRDLMARSLRSSLDMTGAKFARSPTSLRPTWEGTHTLINALEQPAPRGINWAEISAAYGIPPTDMSAVSFASMLAGTEVMLQAGADVVCVPSHGVMLGTERVGWDTHGDGTGERARQMMLQILGPLQAFLQRTLTMPGRNVVTLLWGDFARIGGNRAGSEHANGVSATVFGKYVRPGTTGRFTTGPVASDEFYVLPSGTPGYKGLWSLLTTLTRSASQPWGQTPHVSLVT